LSPVFVLVKLEVGVGLYEGFKIWHFTLIQLVTVTTTLYPFSPVCVLLTPSSGSEIKVKVKRLKLNKALDQNSSSSYLPYGITHLNLLQ